MIARPCMKLEMITLLLKWKISVLDENTTSCISIQEPCQSTHSNEQG